MNNFKRKVLLAVMLFAIAMTATGCMNPGSTIDTVLTINEDGSGSRDMTVTYNVSTFNEYFGGTQEELDAVIASSAPSEMTWDKQEHVDTVVYQVSLSFDSLDDYRKKVESILDKTVDIEITTPDTVWASGVIASEDFASSDLLAGIEQAIHDAGYMTDYEAFSNGETSLMYDGTTYDSYYSNMKIDEVSIVPLNEISVLTTFHGDGTYDRSVIFDIPALSMEKKGTEIKQYLDDSVPDGAEGTWKDGENDAQIMDITQEGMNIDTLNSFNQNVLDSNQSRITLIETNIYDYVLQTVTAYTEYIDFGSYASDSSGYTSYNYYVAVDDDIELNYNGQMIDSDYSDENSDYPGYVLADHGTSTYFDRQLGIYNEAQVESIAVKNEVANEDSMTRTITIGFKETLSEEDLARFANRIKSSKDVTAETDENKDDEASSETTTAEEETTVADEDESTDESSQDSAEDSTEETTMKAVQDTPALTVTSSIDKSTGMPSIIISQSGSLSDIKSSSNTVFGKASAPNYSKTGSIISVLSNQKYTDSIDVSPLIGDSSISWTYAVKTGSVVIWDKNQGDISGAVLTVSGNGSKISVNVSGKYLNIIGLIIWIVVVIVILILLLVVIKTKLFGVFKKKNKPQNMTQATMQPQFQAQPQPLTQPQAQEQVQPQVQEQVQPQVQEQKAPVASEIAETQQEANAPKAKYCMKCGAQLQEGAKFCNKCGAKIEG